MNRSETVSGVAIILFVSALLAIIGGCGYHFRATGHPIGREYKSLAIPMIKSTSTEMGFEADFTTVLREEFTSHSKVPIVVPQRADAIILCRIYNIKEEPVSYRLTRYNIAGNEIVHETTRSKRMIIQMEVVVKDSRSGSIIWKETEMRDQATFLVNDDPLMTRYNRTEALKEIAHRISKRIFLKYILYYYS